VQIGSGEYALQLTARASGQKAADDMTAAGLPELTDDPVPSITTQGRNARISVGMDSAYEIESATNTFADILPGVTVTAARQQAAGDAPVTVTVAADTDGIAAKVKALVDNANVVLNEIASQSKGMTDTTAAGPLVGDSAMRKLSQDILAAVASGVPHLGANDGTASYNDVGVTVDRSGALAFDEAKFRKAYAEDPARTQKYFDSYTDRTTADGKGTTGTFEPGFDTADGLGRKLQTLALVASEGVVDPTDPTKPKQGTLQSLIQRRNEVIRGLNDEVDQWDVRLESRRSALQLQFSNLEVALGKMKQQSSWLAGQLAGLS
jgi:flagellar hook-associated protein 2